MINRRLFGGRRRAILGAILALTLSLFVATAGLAGNMSFGSGGGSWRSPLTFEGVLKGLGHLLSVEVTATAFGTVPAECTNKGGNIAPGQKPLSVSSSADGFWIFDANGRATGSTGEIIPALPDPAPDWKEAGCKNRNWTVTGVIEEKVDWDSVHAVARADDGSTADIWLTCTTSYREDGTTFGVCVES